MLLTNIFAKPVDRPIEGVIKADDNSSLWNEVDEYVLTNEVERRLETFLDAYNQYEGTNGVWISGFFGCGKSHLLKMLSLLLENREVEGHVVADAFEEKLDDNSILKAALKRAVAIPSKSILFNIDQKADVIDKSQADALLKVFVKVFNESCGYFGKHGYIAEFERQLNEDGLFVKFKAAFEEVESQGWEWGRDRVVRMQAEIDAAYTTATGAKVEGVMDRSKADYKLSIEAFAEMVGSYIEGQPDKHFRLNFFVDEVGQYIADNTKLMTNLQTIAESLATRCKGRAWVIVTAQEDMNTIVGEMGKQQGNDFSKIQARFANPMKLTSQDVAEVIQRRLLEKTPAAETDIVALYEHEQNNLKTLFDFTDGQTYRNFENEEHFVNCYPFIPYQFELFQLAIRNLSKQNAFEGRHSSVGERSMLGVFQEVAKQIADKELGELATFDLMFEGIRTALKGDIQASILRAENNLDNPFAVRLLKALFLVKYIREFKPTLRNLRVLMQDRFDGDLPGLSKRLEESLNILESQIYITRNGELFEFLTEKETEIAHEIKDTDVDNQDIADELSTVIFEQVLRSHKIRHDPIQHDYSFTRKLDDRIIGREHELAIHVISPFHNEYGNLKSLAMQSMGRSELLVILPSDDRLIRDLTLYKQTLKYVTQNVTVTQDDSVKRILTDKQHANKVRHADIVERITELLGRAEMYVGNVEVESRSRDANLRIQEGFDALVVQVYINLKHLRGIVYTETQIDSLVEGNDTDLFGGTELSEAETEMLSLIQRNKTKGMATTIKSVVEAFSSRPNGWPLPAIQCVLAKLCGRFKVEATADSETLEGSTLISAIKNTKQYANVLLDPETGFPASQVRRVKDFIQDFFDSPPSGSDPKTLGAECATRFGSLYETLHGLYVQAHAFPFLSVLEEPVRTCKDLSARPYKYFFESFETTADDLLDEKRDTLDPLQNFMAGDSAKIFAEARAFLASQGSNVAHYGEPLVQELNEILDDPRIYASSRMPSVQGLLEQLEARAKEEIAAARTVAEQRLTDLKTRVEAEADYGTLDDDQKTHVTTVFQTIADDVAQRPFVSEISHAVNQFENGEYRRLLQQIHEWATPSDVVDDDDREIVEFVGLKHLTVPFPKATLSNEDDLDQYLESLKTAAMKEIGQGKHIQL